MSTNKACFGAIFYAIALKKKKKRKKKKGNFSLYVTTLTRVETTKDLKESCGQVIVHSNLSVSFAEHS